jgi:predicted dehydrogenase
VRIGFAGLGFAARNIDLPGARTTDGTPVGGFDSDGEQRRSWMAETGLPAYGSLEELLERDGPEVVIVATPPDAHREVAEEALRAGVHIVCEKPLASTVADGEAMAAAALESGRSLAVLQELRAERIVAAVREQIGGPDAGQLVFAQIWQLIDSPLSERGGWRAGSQSLLHAGIHLIDLGLHLFGEPPVAVDAQHQRSPEAGDDDSIHLVTLEFPRGRLAQITLQRVHKGGGRYLEIRADCERASLRASRGGRAELRLGRPLSRRPGLRLDLAAGGLAWRERGELRARLARNPRRPEVAGTGAQLQAMLDAFESGGEPPSPAREALVALAVVEAAYESARAGRRIALDG